ncbi:YeiH family protein [Acidimangrovimonas pyrenivorans]|uniref:YeiH family protein n=1 Tax=Acidimangrovimonas pyrenivorans TaxID=2030798 RepID=A0ABV7AE00_9RHOB
MSDADLTQSTPPAASAARLWPGLLLTGAIGAIAFALHHLPGFGALSPLILAILIGMAVHNVIDTPTAAKAGVKFSLRRILRAGIVLLGLQLTLGQVAAVGPMGGALIAVTLVSTFAFTTWLGRRLGVEAGLAQLIAAGTSICGASAVIATNEVTQAGDEDVAYAVACVTVFGSLSMVLYPMLGALLPLGAHGYGLWAGASIHEVAQVVAAGYQRGTEAGDFATIAKLTRVLMLAPVVIVLGRWAARGATGQGSSQAAPMPWFVIGFLGMVLVASTGMVPAPVHADATILTQFLLAVALAAMGLETDIRKLKAMGLRPLILGAAAWIFIGALALALVLVTGQA